NLIHVDISADVLGKVYTPTIGIVSDVKAFLDESLNVIKSNETSIKKSYREENQKYLTFSTPNITNNTEYADMKAVIQYLQKKLPKDAIITSDAGNFFSWISRYYRYGKENKYIGPTSGAMGYGMPSAIGA